MKITTVSSRRTRIASLFLAILILALSPISVFAYAAPANFDRMDQNIHEYTDNLYFEGALFSSHRTDPFLEYGAAHDIFVDTDGEIFILSDTNPQLIPNACPHTWTDGYLYAHNKNNTGGCTVAVYTCQACLRCKSFRNIVYDFEVTYSKCIH